MYLGKRKPNTISEYRVSGLAPFCAFLDGTLRSNPSVLSVESKTNASVDERGLEETKTSVHYLIITHSKPKVKRFTIFNSI